MDYSSNMNIIVTVINIIKQYGRCGVLSFAHQQSQSESKGVGGWWSGGGGCLLSKLEGSQEKGYGNSHEKLW